jgi:hypothetical protein
MMGKQLSLHIAIESVATFCNEKGNSVSNELKSKIYEVLNALLEAKELEDKLTRILIESAARGIELKDAAHNAIYPPSDA